MNPLKEYKITSGLLDRQRSLLFTTDYLEYENGNLKGKEFTRLGKSAIVDIKHSMEWLVWYKFRVGRKFSITFKDLTNKELKIQFHSYVGTHKEHQQQYSEIIEDIWKFYLSDIVETYLDKFYNDEKIEIHGITLNNTGINLRKQHSVLHWSDVNIKEYYGYFAIYHRTNAEIHSRISYNEYGAEILWSTIKTILKEKACLGHNENNGD